MLQSEFFERTGVNLTGDVYSYVEHIYNSIQMDKDEFCKLWLKNRDNKLIAELMDTIMKLEGNIEVQKTTINSLSEEIENMKAKHEKELRKLMEKSKTKQEAFGKKVITNANDESDLFDILEEEFGMPFIIRTKLEKDIELEDYEKDYLIKNLK